MNKHTVKDWIFATRPWSFPASIIPIIISMTYIYSVQGNYDNINWLNGFLAAISIMLFHAAGNLISDYYDFRNGVDLKGVQGSTILVNEEFESSTVFYFGITLLCIGSLIGGFLVWSAGLWVLWLGIFGAISAWFYYRVKYNALGDVLILLAFGILPTLGTGYVLTSTFIIEMVYLGLIIGLLTVAILHANNTRDMMSDKKAHIKTLAMILGIKWSQIFYFLLLTLPFVLVVVLFFTNVIHVTSFLVFLSMPLVVKNITIMNSVRDNLNVIAGLDVMTAKLQMVFGLLLSISFLLSCIAI